MGAHSFSANECNHCPTKLKDFFETQKTKAEFTQDEGHKDPNLSPSP